MSNSFIEKLNQVREILLQIPYFICNSQSTVTHVVKYVNNCLLHDSDKFYINSMSVTGSDVWS